MAYHGIVIHVAFLKFLYYYIFALLVIFHMHHCVMEIRIKGLADSLDGFYSQLIEYGEQLFVNLIHTGHEGVFLLIFGNRCKAALEVVNHRKQFLNHAFCTHLKHSGFFFLGPFAEVIKLSHLASQFIGKILDLSIFFVFFILFPKEAFFL